MIIQFGRPPNRIDLIGAMKSVPFDVAWERRITDEIVGDGWTAPIFVISVTDLVLSKKAAGRTKDLDDIEHLCPEG